MKLIFKEQPHLITLNDKDKAISSDIVNQKLKFDCNEKIIKFWNEYSHILFDNGVSIYGFELSVERNYQYEMEEYFNDYFLIGDDGSGQGIFLKKRDDDLIVYYLDLGAIGASDFYSTEKKFFEWIENSPSLDDDIEKSVSDLLYEKADLYITSVVDEKNKLIFLLKNKLDIDKSISEMSSILNSGKGLVKANFIPLKYIEVLKEIKDKYNCIRLISKKGENILL